MPGILYVVATPIGNLDDASPRSLEVLAMVDAIACEDTRVTSKLLAVAGIERPLIAYHQHSDDKRVREIIAKLAEGKNIALVTDAGTPAISDPGGLLVRDVVNAFGSEIKIIPIPGPSAAISALSVSGFPCDRFVFLGFPPHKKGRNTWFKELSERPETVVFYESTHRILKTLEALTQSVGERPLVVCRELTKMYETTYRGTAVEITEALNATSLKGEFVVVVGPI